jgi:hypothetical protein
MINPTEDIEMTELDWWFIDALCKEIIGPNHEVERPLPNNPTLLNTTVCK